MAKEIKLDKSYEEIKSIVETSETYSEAARRLFGDDSYSKREKVKRLIEGYGLVFEHKNEKKRYCLFCGKEITGKNRGTKKFCSHSCSASYNNRGVTRNGAHQETKYCLYCGKELKNKRSKFCSCECQKNYEYEEKVKKWQNGEEPGWSGHGVGIKPFLKRYDLTVTSGAVSFPFIRLIFQLLFSAEILSAIIRPREWKKVQLCLRLQLMIAHF